MIRSLFLVLLIGLLCCKSRPEDGILYVSNYGIDKFDSALITVRLDQKIIFSEMVTNKNLSFHWDEKSFSIPSDSFRLSVNVMGQGFAVKKDTLLKPGNDRTQMFVKFYFSPYQKRYLNPNIYPHMDGVIFDFKKFADSLYRNEVVENAEYYLNDTLPISENIEITFKNR